MQRRPVSLALLSLALVSGCADDADTRPGVTVPLPDFQGLSAPVEVRRDDWGAPHVYAHTTPDGVYALGYETARDRLFQLDYSRRRALGTVAELLGDASFADDAVARTIGFGPLGEAGADDLRKNDPEVHLALSAYAAGISAFIDDAVAGRNGASLPPEYADLDPAYRPDAWRVADSLAILKAELFLLAAHPESDLLAYAVQTASPPGVMLDLYRPDPLEHVYVTDGFPAGCGAISGPTAAADLPSYSDGKGAEAALATADALARMTRRKRIGPVGASNNWVLCGQLTQSGAAMLANDPHLDLDLPTNFYELHLDVDDPAQPVHVAGFGFPGAPAIALGHNDRAAWGVTTVEADVADAYVEELDGDSAVFGGEAVPMNVRTEHVRVRNSGGGIGDYEVRDITVRVVPHHGPLLTDAVPDAKLLLGSKRGISIRWLGFGITHEARAFYDLSRAGSYEDFQRSLGRFQAGLVNFVYAGTDGDIGYYPHADYPIRAKLDPANPPYGVVPGGGDYEWTGELIPNRCIPQAKNPPSCRIFTANNDPARVTAGDVLTAPFYLGGTFDYGLRARRIQDHLDALAGGGVTLDDFRPIQGDVHSGIAEHFLPPLLAAASGATLSPAAATLVATLKAWDREETLESLGATVFSAFYSQLLVDVFADDLPLTFDRFATDDRMLAPTLAHQLAGQTAPSGHDYLGGKSPAAVLIGTLEKIAVSLPKELGADMKSWTWGTVHTHTFHHPLGGKYDLGPLPLPGGISTPSSARYAPTVAGKAIIRSEVIEGPNVRIQVELVPGDVRMRAALATGQSGVLGSPHYADQLPIWRQAGTRATYFQRADVVAHSADVAVFPKGARLRSGAP